MEVSDVRFVFVSLRSNNVRVLWSVENSFFNAWIFFTSDSPKNCCYLVNLLYLFFSSRAHMCIMADSYSVFKKKILSAVFITEI